jgi:hypothetical protein
MRPLSHSELLNIWEWGTHRSAIDRGLMLISLSSSCSERDKLLGLSIGERDGRLIRLRQILLGDLLVNVANCPTCDEAVEWEMNINHFQLPDFPDEILEQTYELEIDDFSIQYRLPNTKRSFDSHI